MRKPETFGHYEFFRVRSKLAEQAAYGRQAFADLNISNLPVTRESTMNNNKEFSSWQYHP